MLLTDTHTHIYYHEGDVLAQQITRCLDNNIRRLFLPNVDKESIPRIRSTVAAFPDYCFPMFGLHPCSVTANYKQDLDTIYSARHQFDAVAVGEIGIDLHWNKTSLQWQQEAFKIQIAWAKSAGVPIVIHCRDAFDEIFEILEEMRGDDLWGIFHCFTGTHSQAVRAIDLGMHLGIGGIVTFKNAGLDKVVAEVPLTHIVLETDAPYLAPAPFRGKTNESSYLGYIAEKVAELHGVPLEEVARITTENSVKIFKV